MFWPHSPFAPRIHSSRESHSPFARSKCWLCEVRKTVAQRVRKGLNKHNYREAWLATLDAMLLAKTDVLVGQMTSTLFRSAISLRAAKCDCLLPFVSLDAPFCSDYGVKAGRSPDGAFWC